MPRLLEEEVTATYSGLRAAIDHGDYLIAPDPRQHYVLVGGIHSTGLTSGMAVAEYVRDQLESVGLNLVAKADVPPPPRMPNIGEAFTRPYQDAEKISAEPAYGKIVCFCERVTHGELRDAFNSVIPPAGLGGLRRPHPRDERPLPRVLLRRRSPDHARRGSPMNTPITADVAVIGGGPAGLTATTALANDISLKVLVLERESAAGGIPRHCDHHGYGVRDMKTFITGPAYARKLVEKATAACVDIRTNAMVTGRSDERALDVTSPQGRQRVDSRAIILATGARERPRPAPMIPGDRPSGGSTPPDTCKTWFAFSTARSANARSWSTPSWSAGQRC